jgi:ribosomal protein S18 acetylase RimI-like enzyme
MEKIIIREVAHSDIRQLQKVARQTFFETFSDLNTEVNMKKYLEEELSIEKLSAEINNRDSKFFFAELNYKTIGYLKLNFGTSQTELKDSKALEIERIYVLKEFLGQKVGKLLFEKACQIARLTNMEYIWLAVWEKNPRAIKFYKKNGFIEFDKHIFKLGDDEQTDIMMRLQLKINEK